MKFEAPDRCGTCSQAKIWYANKYYCGAPVSKTQEMLDVSTFEVTLDSRPEWCPLVDIEEHIKNLPEKDKMLFEKVCDGFSALFELIDSRKEQNGESKDVHSLQIQNMVSRRP